MSRNGLPTCLPEVGSRWIPNSMLMRCGSEKPVATYLAILSGPWPPAGILRCGIISNCRCGTHGGPKAELLARCYRELRAFVQYFSVSANRLTWSRYGTRGPGRQLVNREVWHEVHPPIQHCRTGVFWSTWLWVPNNEPNQNFWIWK